MIKHVDVASSCGVLWWNNMPKSLKYSMRFPVIWDIFSQYAIISDIWDIFLQYALWMSKSHLEKNRLLLSESSKCWSYHALAKASYMGSSILNVFLPREREGNIRSIKTFVDDFCSLCSLQLTRVRNAAPRDKLRNKRYIYVLSSGYVSLWDLARDIRR